ncbi:MAG TPA: protein-glutamate O-methyltransferase CheR [Bryobacteraceae bacterium]|nr:protein-glutamate O-methyltransferase CheR [Bryobacteraceae bacterium]
MGATAATIQPENLFFLCRQIYTDSGIVLEQGKEYLLEARLIPIMREQGLRTLDELCLLLQADHDRVVRRRVVEAITTNETYFFREPTQYDALRRGFLPDLMALRQTSRKLSFWSAASSTGQEAYSLAMMLSEMGLAQWNIDILGTDLNGTILDRAREGSYSQIEVNRGLPAQMLLKYFRRAGLSWQLKDEIRRKVSFRQLDLRSNLRALGPFDVALCRNVLIYFDLETRAGILRQIHGTLFKGGCVVLGTAELGIPMCAELYRRQTVGGTVVYVAL